MNESDQMNFNEKADKIWFTILFTTILILVSIKTSLNFDGFLLTGLYSINSDALLRSQSPGVYHRQLSGSNLMCSIVFSHISYQPEHEMRFIWKAPPRGTGCVNFL